MLIVVLASGAAAGQAAGADGKTTRFINGQWFDGQRFVSTEWYSVNGRLTMTPPDNIDAVEDLHGGFVVPPFGEAHNHNLEGPWNVESVTARYLRDGVFYVINPNSIRTFTEQIRGHLNRPDSVDAVFADAGLTSTGGHPMPLYEEVLREVRYREVVGELSPGWFNGRGYVLVDDSADLERRWPSVTADHPALIKIYLVRSEDRGAAHLSTHDEHAVRRGLDPQLVPEIVNRSHRSGARVIAHVETAADVRVALVAGVDIIAHAPGWLVLHESDASALRLTDDDAVRAAANGTVFVTTTVAMRPSETGHRPHSDRAEPAQAPHGQDAHAHESYGRHAPGHAFTMSPTLWPLAEQIQRDNLTRLHRHGVRIAIGSDHAETSLDEALHLHQLAIFDNATLLRLWCDTTPQVIFPERRIGRFADGYEASFVVLTDDPLLHFDAVRGIALRVKQGMVLPTAR
ncbi:MAG: hypothetical protein U0172_08560 [Nitrospiraceae bacterium]